MRIHLGTNFQGYKLARQLENSLTAAGHDVHWMGAPVYDANDDYSAIVIRVAQAVVADEDAGIFARGIQVAGEGAGEIVAGEIGDVRREIAYVGDTLNVATRLLDAAKELSDTDRALVEIFARDAA